MKPDGHVLVIGAASIDVKGRPDVTALRGSSTSGQIRSSHGGVARNIAENLAQLEVETILLTAVGDDQNGKHLLDHTAGVGVNVDYALTISGSSTSTYMALLNESGVLDYAVDDMAVLSGLTSEYLKKQRNLFSSARLVALDANLSESAIATISQLCKENNVPLCADPTSAKLASRLIPFLPVLYMTSPNIPEAQALLGKQFTSGDRDSELTAANQLVTQGVEVAIITLGEFGVVYADAETRGHVPARQTQIVDPTGAGDAQTAAIIFGLLEDIPLDECVRLGVAAATLTLRSRDTVCSDLNIDLLYDELAK